MTSNTQTSQATPPGSVRRTLRFTVLAVALLGGGILAATFIGNSMASGGHGKRHGHGWAGADSIEEAEDRGRDMAAWFAGVVDASPEQAERLEAIAAELATDLFPLKETHQSQRRALITELSRPEVDAAALESLRRETLATAEQASLEITEALVAVAETLEPAQRQQLGALAARMGHHRRH